MKEKFNEKVIPIILKFINTKGIQSDHRINLPDPVKLSGKGSCRCIRVYRNQTSIRSGMWRNILHQCVDCSYRYQL